MIYADMIFYNFNEFFDNAERIKKHFETLDIMDKKIYKMYVYSNRDIREHILDKIWEYLNEPFGSCYYVSHDMLSVYKR